MAELRGELKTNDVVGDWKVGKLLGRGGQGAVWVVRNTKATNMPPRALKVSFAIEDRPRQRFQREIELLGKCDSPYVVKLLFGSPQWSEHIKGVQPFAFYVTEECAGSLEQLAPDLDMSGRIALFRDACRGLIHAHGRPEAIIHRDIKPSNFLLAREPRRLALADFGIARELLPSELTATQEVVGSQHFRAPEILSGGEGSVQSDVYSLGRVLEWLLTGDVSRTFDIRAIARGAELSDEVCDAFERILARALQGPPANRYESIQQMLDAIPPVWLAPKPLAVPATAGALDGATVVPTALSLARAKDLIGWRQLEGQLRADYPTRIASWRRDNEGRDKPTFTTKEGLFAVIDRLVQAISGRIDIALVGVYSQESGLVDQRRVLDDLITIPWDTTGRKFAAQAPRGAAFLFHHLHGALACSLERPDLAVRVAEGEFPAHDPQYGRLPAWRLPDLHRPVTFEKREWAWEYLTEARARMPELAFLFALQRDFDVGLASYSMLMSLLEVAYDADSTMRAIEGGQLKFLDRFDVPPMFAEMSGEVRREAAARIFGSQEVVRMVVERAKAKPERVRAVWPMWNKGLNRQVHNWGWDGTDELGLGDLAL